MDAATIARLMSVIPERSSRTHAGTAFTREERLAVLAPYLHWMTPLYSLTRDEQRALGLTGAHSRPVVQAHEDADGADLEGEDLGADLDAESAVPMPEAPQEAELADVTDR